MDLIDAQGVDELHSTSDDRKMYSRSILLESIPSLLISFIGFTIAGSYLEDAKKESLFDVYPLLLVATCILSFKGNIELIFAMHLSSISNLYSENNSDTSTREPERNENNLENTSHDIESNSGNNNNINDNILNMGNTPLTHNHNLIIEYAQFAINNSCMVIIQSIIIGFSVGLVGSSILIARFSSSLDLILNTMCTCIFSCFISTLIVLLILFCAITLFKNFNINPDNVVLPSISAFSDYFTVCSLIFFFKLFNSLDSKFICICSLLFIFSLLPFIAHLSIRSPTIIPICSMILLFLTFFLSSIAGFLIEYFSSKYKFLAISELVFSGLTSATSYIYLNRKLTSIYNQKPHNKKASLFSLLLVSFAISLSYILVSNTLFIKLSLIFSLLFIISFILDVYFLIEIIDVILTKFHRSVEIAGVVALPLITSLADFIGSLVLVSILFITNSIV